MKNRTLRWFPSFAMAALIFVESAIPGKIVNDAGFGNEQLHVTAHFLLFLVLGMCVWYATQSFIQAFVLTFLYALSDEYHQSFVLGRSSSWFDIQVDMIGVFVGLFGIWLWNTFQKVSKTHKK